MKYEKPKVSAELAVRAIQGGKNITRQIDSSFEMTTAAAYEADE
jgi:hypothetical protein